MAESFLTLLSGGVMLATAVAGPRRVTLQWLRLAGIIALALGGLAVFLVVQRETRVPRPARWLFAAQFCIVLAYLALMQTGWTSIEALAFAAFGCSVALGSVLLPAAANVGTSLAFRASTCAGVGAMCGLSLMDMLLGHAYLTAARMTIAPFRRLNLALIGVTVIRAVASIALPLWLQSVRPVEMLWGRQGLYIFTRWGVGLVIPLVFLLMADDCIRRRSTQSATGILYVASVLIFIGEIAALNLVRETGLPF